VAQDRVNPIMDKKTGGDSATNGGGNTINLSGRCWTMEREKKKRAKGSSGVRAHMRFTSGGGNQSAGAY